MFFPGAAIFITVVGTFLGVLITALAAYVIARKDFPYRNKVSFFLYFTTLFNGGMVCSYIFFIRYLHLKDSYWALILPGMFSVFHLLIMRSFVTGIPTALIESGKIDGAGEYKIFFSIVLPQVIKRIVPAMGNEVITLVKDTALVSVIGVSELLMVAKERQGALFSFIPLFIAGVFYFVMNWIVSIAFQRLEKRLAYYS